MASAMTMIPTIARRLASRSTHPMYFHAAIVERGGAYVAVGYNHEGRHAEVMALSKLWPSKRRGVRIWSLRFSKTGRLAMAKPCTECEAFMREHGVRACMYSTPNGIEILKL